MRRQHLHRHEGRKLIDVEDLFQARPPLGRVRFKRRGCERLQIRAIVWSCPTVLLEGFVDVKAWPSVVEVAVSLAKMEAEKILRESFLQYIETKTPAVQFDQRMRCAHRGHTSSTK